MTTQFRKRTGYHRDLIYRHKKCGKRIGKSRSNNKPKQNKTYGTNIHVDQQQRKDLTFKKWRNTNT